MLRLIMESIGETWISDEATTRTDCLDVEKQTKKENHACEICGGISFWKQKKSDLLICESCKPPKTESIVDERIEFENENRIANQKEFTDEEIYFLMNQSWGPHLAHYMRPICECGSHYVEEHGTFSFVKTNCCGCGREI